MLLVPPLLAELIYRRKDNERDGKIRDRCWDYFYFSILFVVFTAYPAVSRNILSTFSCAQLGADGYFLRSDMRIPCPGGGDFNTIWAAIFTALISAGVPVILFLVMVAHGVPCLARKKHHLSLLQGLVQTFRNELSESAVNDLLTTLYSVDEARRVNKDEAMLPFKWLELATGKVYNENSEDEQMQVLSALMKYTYPFGKEAMTYEELTFAVRAQRDALRYAPSNNFEAPESESVVLVLLAFAVRKLGDYSRGAADRSTSLYSLLYKSSKQPGRAKKVAKKYDEADKQQWVKIFKDNVIHFKPTDDKDPDCYPNTIHQLQLGARKNKAFLEEVAQQVYALAQRMHSAKLLTVQEASWDASPSATPLERKTVMRLGFLFQSYRCVCPSLFFRLCICFS